jgi:SecD/SecF fusion protein
MIGLAAAKDTARVKRYLLQPEIRELFPPDLLLMWSHNPYKYDPSQSLFELHALKMTMPGKAPIDGSVIVSARAVKGRSESDMKIDLGMNAEGSAKWAEITRNNIGRCIAVVINGQVRSYPRVQAEISGGNTEITGDFTFEEANDLVNILKSGQLPFELRIADEQVQK